VKTLLSNQRENIENASVQIAESLMNGGLFHAFGSGHSHFLVEEFFHRAGGLIPFNPILEPNLMPHSNPIKAGKLERTEGVAAQFMGNYDFKPGEVLMVFSNSGINPVPIEVAEIGKGKGLFIIAVTSLQHSQQVPSRHQSGKKLFEYADLVIDNGVPKGDALLSAKGMDLSFSPVSGFLGIMIVNTLVSLITGEFLAKGETPMIYQSANTPGGIERNKEHESKYKSRIRIMT